MPATLIRIATRSRLATSAGRLRTLLRAGLTTLAALAAVAALSSAPAQALDDEPGASVGLGQGLRLAPLQRSLSLSTDARTPPLTEPGLAQRGPATSMGAQGARTSGFSLFRSSNWFEGDRLSFHVAGSVGESDWARLGAPDGNGVWSNPNGSAAPGLRAGVHTVESALDYSAPIGRQFGLGLSISQRAGGLRESGYGEERIFSLRFTGRF
jgi:hypothetical protein